MVGKLANQKERCLHCNSFNSVRGQWFLGVLNNGGCAVRRDEVGAEMQGALPVE